MSRLSETEIQNLNICKYTDCFSSNFNEQKSKNEFHCLVDSCASKLCDKPSAIRHIRECHRNVYCLITTIKKAKERGTGKAENIIDLRVAVNVNDIWNGVVELITQNGLPFRFVESNGFRKIIQPYEIALRRQNIYLNITAKQVKERIKRRTEEIKEHIRNEVKGKPVAVQLDIASRYNRSVLGVNISYAMDGEIKIRTLAMKAIRVSHTASNIKIFTNEVLSDYGIGLYQIISVTTDNGTNVVKSIDLLEDALRDSLSEGQQTDSECGQQSDSDDGNVLDALDEQHYMDIMNLVRSSFNECHTHLISGVSCACHTLHLVIMHAMEKTDSDILKKARELCKKLRTFEISEQILAANLNGAQLDVVTRWNSTYLMVIDIDTSYI